MTPLPRWLIKQEALTVVEHYPDDARICPECFSMLRLVDGEVYYCPNEMCLNETQYDLEGGILPEQFE